MSKNCQQTLIICGWLLVIIATSLLFFNTPLTSDSLYLEDVAKNLFLYNGSWVDWRFTPSPNYVPDMALYFIAFKLLAFPVERILFVTIAEALLVSAAVIFLAKKIKQNLSAMAQTTLLALIALTSLVSVHCNMWLYFNTTNNHVGALIFSLLALGCLISYLREKKQAALISLSLISIIAIVCDELFIIGFYATAIVLICFFLSVIGTLKNFKQYKNYKIPLFTSLIAILIAYPLASIISSIVTFNNPVAGRLSYTWFGIMYSINYFLEATKNIFYPFNAAAWLYALLVILALLGCIFLFIRLFSVQAYVKKYNIMLNFSFVEKDMSAFVFCLFFLVLLIPINLAGAIFSGGFTDIYAYRYFMLPIALAFILIIVYLDNQITERGRRVFVLVVYLILMSILLASLITLKQKLHGNKWQEIQYIQQNGTDTIYNESAVAACVEAVSQKEKLTAGIANYWYARSVSFRLSSHIPITAVDIFLRPHFWMNTLSSIYPTKKPIKKYNFIIAQTKCTAPHPNSCLLITDIIGVVPAGYKQFTCQNTSANILVYQNDALNNFLRKYFAISLFQADYFSKATIEKLKTN
jgi:hypothetical protein